MSKYKAPVIEMLEKMKKDIKKAPHLKAYIKNKGVLKQALDDIEVLDRKAVARDDIGYYYLRGFTAGEVLEGYEGSLTKQGLYNKADKLDTNYQETHKKRREEIRESAEHYFYFDRPNMTGTMGLIRDKYKGKGYSTIYEEYMHKGGVAPKFDKQVVSKTMYIEHYPDLAHNIKPEGVSDRQYKTMLAGFYRFRKFNVDQAIILDNLEEVMWLNPTSDYIDKRREAVNEQIVEFGREFAINQYENPTRANIIVYIETKMEVYGLQARAYYSNVLEQSDENLDGHSTGLAMRTDIIFS